MRSGSLDCRKDMREGIGHSEAMEAKEVLSVTFIPPFVIIA